MKKNKAENYEGILVYLDEKRTPLAFNEKLKELMEEGAFDNENDARSYILTNPIELELYYHKGYGLYGVEYDAIECADVYDPYDGTKMEEWDE